MKEETLVRNLLRHKRVLEGMITAMVGDADVAEDLFQEVAMVMTRKREEAEESCRFVAWGKSIAYNVVRDFRKKMARRKVWTIDDSILETVADVFEETEDYVWEERRVALRHCAGNLTEKEKAILRRRYDEGEAIDNLATSYSMSRGALDTMLYRIRKGLHACVEGRLRHMA